MKFLIFDDGVSEDFNVRQTCTVTSLFALTPLMHAGRYPSILGGRASTRLAFQASKLKDVSFTDSTEIITWNPEKSIHNN